MPLKVIHSFPDWLPLTQTWMHTQVRCLPADHIEPHVVCERTENLDQFAVPHIHVRPEANLPEKLARKLRFSSWSSFLVRTTRQLGAEIVHSHFGPNGWRDLAVRKAPAGHIVTFYGYDVSRLPTEPIWRKRYSE